MPVAIRHAIFCMYNGKAITNWIFQFPEFGLLTSYCYSGVLVYQVFVVMMQRDDPSGLVRHSGGRWRFTDALPGTPLGTWPLRMVEDPAKGRYLVAAQDLAAGQCICTEDPFVQTVHDDLQETVCHCCYGQLAVAAAPPPPCASCGMIRYCSVQCAATFAQAHAVDDAGVVELIADDGVLGAQQRLKEAAVGVKAGRVEDGVFGAEEGAEASLQGLVDVLRAANEAHGGHAVAVFADGFARDGEELRVVGEAEVVVGAEVDDLSAVDDLNRRALGARDDALFFVEASVSQAIKLGAEMFDKGLIHGHILQSQGSHLAAQRAR